MHEVTYFITCKYDIRPRKSNILRAPTTYLCIMGSENAGLSLKDSDLDEVMREGMGSNTRINQRS